MHVHTHTHMQSHKTSPCRQNTDIHAGIVVTLHPHTLLFSQLICAQKGGAGAPLLPQLHPLRIITVTNNPMMTPNPNSFKNKDRILIWYLQLHLSVDFGCLFIVLSSVYMEITASCLCVWPWFWEEGPLCGLLILRWYVYSTRCLCPSVWCCYVSMGLNCSLRGTDKRIEQASYLLTLVVCTDKNILNDLFKKT